MNNYEMTPQYSTVLFTEVWEDDNTFISDIKDTVFSTTLKDNSYSLLFALLYAKYGNSPIANNDINQFKYKLFSIIFMYGPVWEKKLELQHKLRNLTDDEIMRGSKAIRNTALNPDSLPSTQSLDELVHINSQETSNLKKSYMEGYSELFQRLEEDFTAEFLERFRICFKQFVRPEKPILYYEEEGEEE